MASRSLPSSCSGSERDVLSIEYRDGGESQRVEITSGQVDWEEPSARVHLAHLAEDEMATGWRYRQMIERDGVFLSGFDQELWAKLGVYRAWNSDEALALFRLLRNANLRMLDSLSPEQWKHWGDHAERGRLTVADLARHMAGHDINHLRQIERLLPSRTLTDTQTQGERNTSCASGNVTSEPKMGLTVQETAKLPETDACRTARSHSGAA